MSSKPGKQRKLLLSSPRHVIRAMLCSHLDKPLHQKLKRRSIMLRKGDTVKVMRGTFKGKSGKIERLDVKRFKVYITGIDRAKRDGSKALVPLHPSKLLITSADESDKRRFGGK